MILIDGNQVSTINLETTNRSNFLHHGSHTEFTKTELFVLSLQYNEFFIRLVKTVSFQFIFIVYAMLDKG